MYNLHETTAMEI